MGNSDNFSVSTKNTFAILVLYGFYFLFFHQIVIFLTVLFDPQATIVHQGIQVFVESIIILCMLYFSRSRIKIGFMNFKASWKKNCIIIVGALVLIIFLNYVLSYVLLPFTKQVDSANQTAIVTSLKTLPYYMIFSTVVAAPVIEEALFRVAIFGSLRKRYTFVTAAFVSSALFGIGHVLLSLTSGNLQDLPFVILYIAIGFVFATIYEKTSSILVPYMAHMLNNALSILLILL